MTPTERLKQAGKLHAIASKIEECSKLLNKLETAPPPYYNIFAKNGELNYEIAKVKYELEVLENQYDRILNS